MIVEIPSPEEFADSGVSFLSLAWDAAVQLLLTLARANIDELDHDGAISDDYWRRAQRPLATAVTLAQQGAEFLLKSRIAQVSPFLLVSGQPREWPKGCDKSDVSFADFRTIDAQDLLRVHETVSSVRLSTEFRQEFERMRHVRNSLVHTVSSRHRFAPREVIRWVLRTHKEFLPTVPWPVSRFRHVDTGTPGGAFWSEYGWEHVVASELRAALDALSPAECVELLAISKDQRFYYCAACYESDFGMESHVKTAQLRPNTPSSTTVFCHACQRETIVSRTTCHDCPGNVVEEETGYRHCLSCAKPQELDEDAASAT